ncbi:MAG TPA: MATE family efflux transporter, partial [Solirubrobacterales bacterium]|nr:MATE family efflux transporter [Solirubrobacterales bacterium]
MHLPGGNREVEAIEGAHPAESLAQVPRFDHRIHGADITPVRVVNIRLLQRQAVDREILRLAVPAVGALIAEPLFLLADSAMVGHLGTTPLAGLGLASAVLQTIIGLMVFLAYSTTPAVARWLGAGDRGRAVSVGIDGLWLALGLGVLLALAGWFATPLLVAAFGAEPAVAAAAVTYLGLSMLGLPAMLLVFAATGLLRGLQDTRTPLWVAGIGFAVNIVLNLLFIYGLGLGIAGSAIGTVVAQWGMVAVYLGVIVRQARRDGARLRPHRTGMLLGAASGGWLFLRTVSLRAAMLLAVFVAARLGSPELAAFQIAMTLFATLAFALDALAIAAQALVGRGLGAGDLAGVRAVLRRCLEWGVLGG